VIVLTADLSRLLFSRSGRKAVLALSQTFDNMKPFETLDSKAVPVGRLTILQDDVLVAKNNTRIEYDYVLIREGVCVLAFHGGDVLAQRQYRYPIRSFELELPGGYIDPGESPKEAAGRELLEETGYTASRIESLGIVYPSFGSTNEKIHLFAAWCDTKTHARLEKSEVIESVEIPYEELKELARNGEFRHGAGLAALCRAERLLS